MRALCHLCHHPVLGDNRYESQRRVERRVAVSGRTKGYAYINLVAHKDCSKTPEAKAERIATAKAALELAGVDRARWDEVLSHVQ